MHEIERFDDADVKRVEVTQADHDKFYSRFYHVMSHQWQEEIIGTHCSASDRHYAVCDCTHSGSVFDLITATADATEGKQRPSAACLGENWTVYVCV